MTPQVAMHIDRQAIAAQYTKYAYDFNTRNLTALGHLLTSHCRFDVRGANQKFMPYIRQEMQHSEILKLRVLKIVVKDNTATALAVENNWRTGGPPSYSPIARQDLWIRTSAGWRISRIHISGVTMTVVQ